MALRFSSGLVLGVISQGSYQQVLEGPSGFALDLYSGNRPADPNEPASGSLLVSVTLEGGASGLRFDASSPGRLQKPPAAQWAGPITTSGQAGWFRLRQLGDNGASSSQAVRFDGTVAQSGADLNLSTTSLVKDAPFVVREFSFDLPRGL